MMKYWVYTQNNKNSNRGINESYPYLPPVCFCLPRDLLHTSIPHCHGKIRMKNIKDMFNLVNTAGDSLNESRSEPVEFPGLDSLPICGFK